MTKNGIRTYEDLLIWQKSMNLVTKIYLFSNQIPSCELYGLTSQIRRCAISIPSNIAEGYGRNSKPEFIRFLRIAMGSLFELQTQIRIAYNLKYISIDDFNIVFNDTKEIERMLSAFIQSIKK